MKDQKNITMQVCDPIWRALGCINILLLKCLIYLQGCLHLFFVPFHILVCACWWVVEQQAPPRSPGYEAETAELPIFILAAAWATYHCHSSLIKGINSKFCQSKVRSLNVFTDALNVKRKVWGEATASAVETTSPPVASVIVFLKPDCQFPCFLTPSTAKIPVCLPINLLNKCFPTSE